MAGNSNDRCLSAHILDFYCADAGSAIEVDGMQHLDDRAQQDRERTAYLERNGVRVLRFWNSEVSDNLDGVLEAIYVALGRKAAPSPGASRRRRASGTPRRPLREGRGVSHPDEKDVKNR
jgi:hypothetical protein